MLDLLIAPDGTHVIDVATGRTIATIYPANIRLDIEDERWELATVLSTLSYHLHKDGGRSNT